MAPKVKAAMDLMTEAVSIALTCAVAAAGIYALMFVDLTGNGRLWDALRGVAQESSNADHPGINLSRVRRVPVRPVDMEAEAQNHMLVLPEVPQQEIKVVVAEAKPVSPEMAVAPEQMTDAPADKTAGKDWRAHLTGALRTFTVYGEGEQSSSASASSVKGTSRAAAAAPAPTQAAPESAYQAGAAAEARPGIGDHVSRVSGGTQDGVRNFR
jgi:hypothetical protein